MKNFYAVEYVNGRDTTTGEPNDKTRRMNIAIRAKVFDSHYDRNTWVLAGEYTSAMQGNCREEATLRQLRKLTRGLSVEQFSECVKHLHYIKHIKLRETKPCINTYPATPPNSPLSHAE